MNLTIANLSSNITPQDFQRVVTAIGRQVTEHFQPEWGKAGKLKAIALTVGPNAAPIDTSQQAIIYVGDDSQDPTTGVENALGYHARNNGKIPFGFVYLDVCAKYGEQWSTTLSHEVLELLEDPTAVKSITGPAPSNPERTVYYDLEVCDPTQGDSYEIDGVTVSNFVGRAYFGQSGGSGKTNYLDLPLDPFGVRPKGYFQYEYGSRVYQVNGQKVTQSMLDAKRSLGRGRRNARRAERLERDASVSVSGTTGTSGSSVTGTLTVHFEGAPLSLAPSTGARPPRDSTFAIGGSTGTTGGSVGGTLNIRLG
jgi:hypothetical protein